MNQLKLKSTFIGMLALAGFGLISATTEDKKEIKKIEETIQEFVATADAQDADKMNEILDPNFSSVANQLFGSETTSITSRDTYIQMLRDKKIGGDKRTVEVLSVDVNGNNAYAKAIFDGSKLKFTTYIFLAKDKNGIWRIVTDYPSIEMKG
ncbi:MAG: nuclear transport factor 2 family protein [Flavobacteriales bacterium]|jgi:ketosteroid isomerase-like protein|nr:nuclear transport factor 2 family protein [Flavobacteriales bacterium]